MSLLEYITAHLTEQTWTLSQPMKTQGIHVNWCELFRGGFKMLLQVLMCMLLTGFYLHML